MIKTYKRGDSIAQIAQCVADAIGRNQVVEVLIGEIDATDQKRVFVAPCKCYIKDADLVTETTLAKHATAYRTFQLKNVTQTKDLNLAAKTTEDVAEGVAVTADTPYSLTPDQYNEMAKDDVIELSIVKASTPSAQAEGSVHLVISFDEDDKV